VRSLEKQRGADPLTLTATVTLTQTLALSNPKISLWLRHCVENYYCVAACLDVGHNENP